MALPLFVYAVCALRAFCFQLNVAKSSFFRYQSALLVAAHSLVFILAVVSSQLLVQLVFHSFVLSPAVKNNLVDHSVIILYLKKHWTKEKKK